MKIPISFIFMSLFCVAPSLLFGANLTVSKSSQITLSTSQSYDLITIEADHQGSGQLIYANQFAPSYNRVHFDLQLYSPTLGTPDPKYWTPFGLPFKPIALVGIDAANNEVPLVFDQDYMLYKYNGQERANLRQGWERVSDIANVMPGVGYMIACRKTTKIRFIGGNNISSKIYSIGNAITLDNPLNTTGCATCGEYEGINYISQPTSADASVQESTFVGTYVYNSPTDTYLYEDCLSKVFKPNQALFVVPIVDSDLAVFLSTNSSLVPPPKFNSNIAQLAILKGQEKIDKVYLFDDKDADTTRFQKGKDVVKMFGMFAPVVPQLWINASNMKLTMHQALRINELASFKLGFYMPADTTIQLAFDYDDHESAPWLFYKGKPYLNLSLNTRFALSLNKGFNNDYEVRINHAPDASTDLKSSETEKPRIYSQAGKIFISNLSKNSDVYCYSVDGSLINFFPSTNQNLKIESKSNTLALLKIVNKSEVMCKKIIVR